jgi:undecaprenyl diphosphate synthase
MKALLGALQPGSTEWTLANAIDPNRLPAHVAIIMDGNGRWAKRRNLPRVAGHKAGIASVRTSVETCAQLGLQALTLYAFSVENWKRPRSEVETLWRLLRVYLRRELPTLQNNNIRLSVIGRPHALSGPVRRDLEATCAATAANTGLRLTLAINYGGRAEITDAVRQLVCEAEKGTLSPESITEEHISARLYTAGLPDPDLLIRTSGEMRVSNFLLWQIAYAELYVTEVLWPDFNREELLRALVDYQKRDRRFGGLSAGAPPASMPQPAEEEPLGVSPR